MGEGLVLDRPAPPTVVELDAAGLERLAEQQSADSLHVVLPEAAFGVTVEQPAAEDPTVLPDHLAREEYQRSLEAYRTLGALALQEQLDTPEGRAAQEGLRRMWVTSLAEILENDEEFRGFFEINDYYEYEVQDKHVMAAPGKPMVELVRDGARKSRAEAATDPRMTTQANRDDADVFNAERVDGMVAGDVAANTRFVVSKSPRKAMADDPEFWKSKGYRNGLAFGQLYFFDGAKVGAGTFSIDNVDDAVFDQVLAEYNVKIPAGRTSDYAVLDGVERIFDSREQALAFAREFRARCYALQGDTRHRQSVNEFMDARAARIDAAFDALCVPLSESVESKQKHQVIHTFVSGLLEAEENLKPEAAVQLRAICASETFTDDDGRLLAGLTLYAIAEELYDDAQRLVKGESSKPQEDATLGRASDGAAIAQHLAGRVRTGVAAGRDHGGACAGMTSISNKLKKTGEEEDENDDERNPQAAYGGKGNESKANWRWKTGVCRVENCPTRPSKTKVGPCAVCRRCQHHFDKGRDPATVYAVAQEVTIPAAISRALLGQEERRASAWLN